MSVSRRSFLARGAAAVMAASLPAKASEPSRSARSTKKGLAGIAPENSGLSTNWYYDWRLHPATTGMPVIKPAMRFYPMCWGWKPAHPDFDAQQKPGADVDGSTSAGVDSLRGQKLPLLFGFNEPDKLEQSNLTVEQAVEAWSSLQGVSRELVSPACAKPRGEWMAKFIPEIERRKLQLDSLGYHTYPGDSVDAFIEGLEAFHAKYQRPVWVTEFAVADWTAKAEAPIGSAWTK